MQVRILPVLLKLREIEVDVTRREFERGNYMTWLDIQKNWFVKNRKTGELVHITDFLSKDGRYVSNGKTGKAIVNCGGVFNCCIDIDYLDDDVEIEIEPVSFDVTDVRKALMWYVA